MAGAKGASPGVGLVFGNKEMGTRFSNTEEPTEMAIRDPKKLTKDISRRTSTYPCFMTNSIAQQFQS